MRLLVVTNDYPPKPGGIQQYLAGLTGAYPDPYRVLAPRDGPAHDEQHVVRHGRRFMWPTPGVAAWIEAETRHFDPDVILFGAPYPLPLVGPRLRNRLGVPYGILAHGAEITVPAVLPGIRQIIAKALRDADVRFATSRFTAGALGRYARRPVVRIGAGVDAAAFRPDPTGGPFSHAQRAPVVGCVSRFVPRKGQVRVLRAAAELARRGRPVRVLLVGRGRMERRLRRLATELRLDARFEVDVPWARLPALFREMDVFCMPCRSRWAGLEVEGLGLVFLEAAASGIPVLAGVSGGSPETVIPGRTGFVVHSVADIVEGLDLLVSDPAGAAAMGSAGREWVEAEWTWPRVVERLQAGFGGAV